MKKSDSVTNNSSQTSNSTDNNSNTTDSATTPTTQTKPTPQPATSPINFLQSRNGKPAPKTAATKPQTFTFAGEKVSYVTNNF